MPQPPSRSPRSPGVPRWGQLAVLGALVLAAHVWLLGGEWPSELPTRTRASGTVAEGSAAQQDTPATPGAAAPSSAAAQPLAAVTVSTVRWLAPPAAQPTRPRATPKPTQPTSPKRAQAAPPAPAAAAPASAARAGSTSAASESAPPASPPLTPPAAVPERAPEPTGTSVASTPLAAAPLAPSGSLAPTAAESPSAPETTATGGASPGTTPPAAPAVALPPAQPPASAALAYEVNGTIKGLSYQATASLNWALANGRYDARMVVRLPLLGSLVQTSTGRTGPAGLLPERFSDARRSERAAHFDHEQQRIRFSVNTPDAPLQAGAQDRLSLFLQLAARFNAAPQPLQAGQVIEFQVAGTADAEPWRFRVDAEETLSLPAGALPARRLVRELRQPRDSQVEVWLAPSLEHLPVRIRIEQQSGDQIDQQLSRLP